LDYVVFKIIGFLLDKRSFSMGSRSLSVFHCRTNAKFQVNS